VDETIKVIEEKGWGMIEPELEIIRPKKVVGKEPLDQFYHESPDKRRPNEALVQENDEEQKVASAAPVNVPASFNKPSKSH